LAAVDTSSTGTDSSSSPEGEKIMYSRPRNDLWKNPFPSPDAVSSDSSSTADAVSTKVESGVGVFLKNYLYFLHLYRLMLYQKKKRENLNPLPLQKHPPL
jgi:hypothetical protein